MSETPLTYDPTRHFENQNGLFGNHFRFVVDAFPDLTFFVQSVVLPAVTGIPVTRDTPFTQIHEVPDHLNFSSFDVTFLIDAQFKTYSSLFWWMSGYGFPQSYDQIEEFRAKRRKQLANPRPLVREMEKTNATLYILQPDTEITVAEIHFFDLFPTTLGQIEFNMTTGDVSELRCTGTFHTNDFDVVPR